MTVVTFDEALQDTLIKLVEHIKQEMQNPGLAEYELLISYMKIFLISASRAKMQQGPFIEGGEKEHRAPFILQNLKEAIDKDFKSKHTPADYAAFLNISPNALARSTKNYFNKTLTHLITERIITEAKRELYLTNKSIKEVAYELGYDDEYYFSRLFKKNVSISPHVYRQTVGFGKAE
jgi:AraC-like DNA-binding protein